MMSVFTFIYALLPKRGRHSLLHHTIILFAISSAIAAVGVMGAWYSYGNALTTFSSRLGARTLFYHLTILLLRTRDPNVLEHGLNIITSMALGAVWIGGAIWSLFFGADIWGYKFCAGCRRWDILESYGGLIAAAEGVVLCTSAALFFWSRAARPSLRDGSRETNNTTRRIFPSSTKNRLLLSAKHMVSNNMSGSIQ
ncbi:hypothetical protein B0J17DRAFT_716697 [Rhizoctonia solani]|nr:hypothetical protein B0J17DRAFT_716697 [Rhizoctonia solani]